MCQAQIKYMNTKAGRTVRGTETYIFTKTRIKTVYWNNRSYHTIYLLSKRSETYEQKNYQLMYTSDCLQKTTCETIVCRNFNDLEFIAITVLNISTN